MNASLEVHLRVAPSLARAIFLFLACSDGAFHSFSSPVGSVMINLQVYKNPSVSGFCQKASLIVTPWVQVGGF